MGFPLSVININADTRRHRKLLNTPMLSGPKGSGMSAYLLSRKILKMIVLKKGAGKWHIKCQANSGTPAAYLNL